MNFKLIFCFFIAIFGFYQIEAKEKTREEILREEGLKSIERAQRFAAQFYTLDEGEDVKEITSNILESSDTKDETKKRILANGRRFFLFKYPSDEFQVKGCISFVPDPEGNPLLIFLRGGNRLFALMHPAYACMKNYTVLTTTYRGGVSEGVDEFGGNEVNDVENLVKYFPIIEEKLKQQFNPGKVFMMGGSRGAFEMFLALERSPFLQNYVTKVISLTGMLDMRETIADREDMKTMFVEEFGLVPGQNEEEWINLRDPINNVSHIRKDLPILIIQGTEDNRVPLTEGYHMVEKLQSNGNAVEYLEVPGGDHFLSNQPNAMEIISNWFEK
jgi:dipeptidyl aminopeptidase/acylaminoacyl peptidase